LIGNGDIDSLMDNQGIHHCALDKALLIEKKEQTKEQV
jgi:hypothetical protein